MAGGDVLWVAVLAPFVEVVALFFAGGVAGHDCSGDAQQGAGRPRPRRRVSDIVHGKYHVATVPVLTRIADGLDMPADARILLRLAPGQDDTRPAPSAGPPGSGAAEGAALAPDGMRYPATTGHAMAVIAGLWNADADMTSPLSLRRWTLGAGTPPRLPGWSASLITARLSLATAGRWAWPMWPGCGMRRRCSRSWTTGSAEPTPRALISYLSGDAAGLLAGRYGDDVGRELFGAVSEASLLAGWASYDCGLHGLGQRYFVRALRLADAGADRRLGSSVLSAMSHQATFLGHRSEAVSLARAAEQGLRAVATPTLTAQFQAMQARALAGPGDARACELALAAAERSFAQADPGQDPEFIRYFNEAELAAELGHCFRDLGQPRRAVEHAARAVAGSDGQYPRSDFFVTMVLADAYADLGDPEQACDAALGALRLGQALTSARCVAYLREFRQRLDRFDRNRAVRDFREQAAGFSLWAEAA